MSECTVRPLEDSEHREAARLLAYLNPECSRDVLLERFQTIVAEYPHYHPVGAFIDGKMVGFAAAWVATKVWCGRYLEIDNIVVHPDHRRRGGSSAGARSWRGPGRRPDRAVQSLSPERQQPTAGLPYLSGVNSRSATIV